MAVSDEKKYEIRQLKKKTDFSDGSSIEYYAMHLEGMTFRDVLDLDIHPEGGKEHDYENPNYKGGMGTLLEERYFGYEANNDNNPDFSYAGVELKATCFDTLKKSPSSKDKGTESKRGERATGDKFSAGERLVLTMIPLDRPIESDFYNSHLWEKCHQILLVYYHREREINKLDQRIEYTCLFTPTIEDQKIIKQDYEKIVSYVQEGRADELSESTTMYLGACTKGSTAKNSWRKQFYPRIDENGHETYTKAKKRAFAFKRQYMDYVLHTYLMGENSNAEKIASQDDLEQETFENHIIDLIQKHVGKTDEQLCQELDVSYSTNGKKSKSLWSTLAFRMLGIRSNHAEEFAKAGINARTIRIEPNGKIKENLSFPAFEFDELLQESWEESELRACLDETKFFFTVFKKSQGEDCYRLRGCCFWSMPVNDIEGPAQDCWNQTRKVISKGVELEQQFKKDGTPKLSKKGKPVFSNNLPKSSENSCMHVRPHTQDSFYDLGNGRIVGEKRSNASELPDGRWMTKQCFWLNNDYVLDAIEDELKNR